MPRSAAIFLTALMALAQAPPKDALLTDGGLHVLLCGTGSPMPDANRAGACIAVAAAGQVILLDAGPGSWRALQVANWPTGSLAAVFLSHYHSDHIGGLGEAITQSWIAGRAQPLMVHGPGAVDAVVKGFNAAYAPDASYRTAHHTPELMPPAAAPAAPRGFATPETGKVAVVFERNGLKVSAFRVSHDPATPAVGYKVEFAGRSLVYSGDTAYDAAIAKHAAGADLLLHDTLEKNLIGMASANLERQGRTRQARMIRDTLTYHASPAEVARTAAEAKVETLVLFHCVPPPNGPLEAAFTRGLAEIFGGRIVIARDGMTFDFAPKP